MKKDHFDYRIFILIILTLSVVLTVNFTRERTKGSLDSIQKKHFLTCDKNGLIVTDDKKPRGFRNKNGNLAPLFFEKILINDANSELLQTIPGIGPELAANIIFARKNLGRFEKTSDLLKVKGVGKKRKEYLKTRLDFD